LQEIAEADFTSQGMWWGSCFQQPNTVPTYTRLSCTIL